MYVEALSEGRTTFPSMETTALKTADAVARIDAFNQVIEIFTQEQANDSEGQYDQDNEEAADGA
jgi:hypothetical protein